MPDSGDALQTDNNPSKHERICCQVYSGVLTNWECEYSVEDWAVKMDQMDKKNGITQPGHVILLWS